MLFVSDVAGVPNYSELTCWSQKFDLSDCHDVVVVEVESYPKDFDIRKIDDHIFTRESKRGEVHVDIFFSKIVLAVLAGVADQNSVWISRSGVFSASDEPETSDVLCLAIPVVLTPCLAA